MPDVRHVARKPPGDDEDGIDAQVVARPQEARGKALGGDNHTPQPPRVERQRSCLFGGAGLYLDERKDPAAPGDDVALAAGHPGSAGEDAPAVQAEPPTGQRLGSPAAFLGSFAIQRESSSARA